LSESKVCITCKFHDGRGREFFIDEEQRVWPCCYYYTDYMTGAIEDRDPKFHQKLVDDPKWNSLSDHPIKDILATDTYSHDIWVPGWETNPTKACVLECGLKPKKIAMDYDFRADGVHLDEKEYGHKPKNST